MAGVPEFARATAADGYAHNTTVPFGGVQAKYVKLTVNSAWGTTGLSGLSEVRFFSIPVQAREPGPADAATGVGRDAVLSWRPGREAGVPQGLFRQGPGCRGPGHGRGGHCRRA